MLFHDPEVPAGYQDADIEQAAFEAEGRRLAALRARGVCSHGHRMGGGIAVYSAEDIARSRARGKFPDRPTADGVTGQASIPAGQDLCLDCGSLVAAWR